LCNSQYQKNHQSDLQGSHPTKIHKNAIKRHNIG